MLIDALLLVFLIIGGSMLGVGFLLFGCRFRGKNFFEILDAKGDLNFDD